MPCKIQVTDPRRRHGRWRKVPVCDFVLDCSPWRQTGESRLHNEFKASRPRFAMVCPELVRVTGCFPHDRDRKRTYPPPKRPGPDRKSSRIQAFTAPSAGSVAWRPGQALTRCGIAPGGKERNLQAVWGWIRTRRAIPTCDIWPECCTFFGQPGRPGLAIRTLTHPDNSRITRS